MKLRPTIWKTLLLPSVSFGVVFSVILYLFSQNALMAAAAFGASCATCVIIASIVNRHAETICARLRRQELRDRGAVGTGLYSQVMQEAFDLLNRSESEARIASNEKTKLEAAYHAADRKTSRMEETLNSLETPVLITDGKDELLFHNQAAIRLFGSDDQQSKKTQLSDIPALQQLVQETRTRKVATEHRSAEFEWAVDGAERAFRAKSKNISSQHGSSLGVVTVLEDIVDERLAKTRHAEFVSSVSHELKTPMAGIKAYIELLMDGDVEEPEEQQELFGYIDNQVDRLTRLVNNMLNLARIESGVIKITRKDYELNDVLRKAFEIVQPSAEDKNIRMVSELSDLYLPVHLDDDLFVQAIVNLLSNAVKYTPAGGEVRLQSQMEETTAVIKVQDSGMGIPADSLPHIFERFYRVPENNKAAAGTGLGLALVHYVSTDIHNGQISVESVIDQGSCFSITLPLGHRDQNQKKLRQQQLAGTPQ